MMALSLTNITATSPTVPPAPPGVALADVSFDLLMPVADATDPRHEPAPDGKQIGKNVPVDEAETPNPLAWLTPPVAPPVTPPASPPLPQAPATIAGAGISVAIEPARRPVTLPVPTAAGEPEPVLAVKVTPIPLPAAPAVTPRATDETVDIGSPAPPVPQQLSSTSAVLPTSLALATPPRAAIADAPAAPRPITHEVSPLLAAPTGRRSIAPPAAPAPTPIQVVAAPAPAAPIVIPASPWAVEPAMPGTSDKPPPRDRLGSPDLLRLQEPGVALETRPAPLAPAPTTPRIAPAALIFADAIHRATRDDRDPATPGAAMLTAVNDIRTHAITATTEAQHTPLDLSHEQWPARMIERIEALRDAANANDTSIRLIPDALGKIDVSLKRDGDTVAVHFSAHQADTRQLLAEAAPKLAELAEARGLKLTQGGADTNGQQHARQQKAAPASTAIVAPQPAIADETEPTDTRIA